MKKVLRKIWMKIAMLIIDVSAFLFWEIHLRWVWNDFETKMKEREEADWRNQ